MKTEIKVGLVGFAILVLLFVGIKFLKGVDLFNSETTYYAIYDNVSGMHESNYIYLNGMKVGYIKDIKMIGERAEKFKVTISIDSKIKLPKDSKIVFYSADILGSKALRLELGESKELLSSKDTLATDIELGMLDKLSSSIEPMAQNLDSILLATKNILNSQTQDNLKKTFDNLEQTSQRLNSISTQFDALIASDRKICKMFTYIIKYQCFISRKVEKERSDFLCFVTNKQQISQDKSQTLLGSLLSRCKDITKNWILQTFPL